MIQEGFAHSHSNARFPALICGLVTSGVGCLVLIGWVLDIPALRSMLPGLVAMKTNTAISFALAGLALALKASWGIRSGESREWAVLADLCAALVALTGALTLCEYVFGWNPGIDLLVLKKAATAAEASLPGRLAVPTAIGFLLLGSALVMVNARGFRAAALWLAAVSAVLALPAFFGHLYNIPFLPSFGPFTPMALYTALTFGVLCAGILLVNPNSGLVARIGRKGAPAGFACAFVLLIVLGNGVWINSRDLVPTALRIAHTHEVIAGLGELLSAAQTAETKNRGYCLARDKRFLDLYYPALDRIAEAASSPSSRI